MRRLLQTAAFIVLGSLPTMAQDSDGVAGPYLAARSAAFYGDFARARPYFETLLANGEINEDIAESALVVFAVTGDFGRAADVKRTHPISEDRAQVGRLIELVDLLEREDYAGAEEMLAGGPVTGPLLDGLLAGWINVAQGEISEGLVSFDKLAENEAFHDIARTHRAYILRQVGDLEGAVAILSGETYGDIRTGLRGLEAQVQLHIALGRDERAGTLLADILRDTDSDTFSAIAKALAGGSAQPEIGIKSARAGMAEAFLTLATVFNSGTSDTFTLLHSRAAMALDPSLAEAALVTAEVFEEAGQLDLALDALENVPQNHPNHFSAERARANILFDQNQPEAALEVLRALQRDNPESRAVYVTIGDIQRRTDNFEGARTAYSKAIELSGPPQRGHWFLYYVRGIANERTGRWPEAEADFEQTLALNPNQALVLNYYGYSLVEQRERLDEALAMIAKAVKESNEQDGFIIDSLGWVLYRLGRYEEAVAPMEKAVELEPVDPVINDHLGDVYWKVGRIREAEFQWRRALSFVPEPNTTDAEPDRIRLKLEIGLDEVLAQEAVSGPVETAADK